MSALSKYLKTLGKSSVGKAGNSLMRAKTLSSLEGAGLDISVLKKPKVLDIPDNRRGNKLKELISEKESLLDRFRDWSAAGQPSREQAHKAIDDIGIENLVHHNDPDVRGLLDTDFFAAEEHSSFPRRISDEDAERKIRGFTKWMQKKKLEQ